MPPARLAICTGSSIGMPVAKHGGKNADDGVAGPGDIVDFARLSRHGKLALRTEKRHAFFGTCKEQIVKLKLPAQILCAFDKRGFACPGANNLPELSTVGRNDGGAVIAAVVVPFGIDREWEA